MANPRHGPARTGPDDSKAARTAGARTKRIARDPHMPAKVHMRQRSSAYAIRAILLPLESLSPATLPVSSGC